MLPCPILFISCYAFNILILGNKEVSDPCLVRFQTVEYMHALRVSMYRAIPDLSNRQLLCTYNNDG